MTPPAPIDAVVSGSKGFALALLAPLAERIGSRPRVAADPAQALAFCRGPNALVVVEFHGEDTLRAIQHLVLEGDGIHIVAAVSPAHVAAEGPLRALGAELARWEGSPEPVLAAIAQRLAAPRAAPQPAPVAPPRIAPPVLTPSRPQAAVARPAAKPAAAPPPSAAALFDDLATAPEADAFDVDVEEPPPVFAPALATGPWPTAVPGPVEAADALGRGLAGKIDPPGTPFGSVKDVLDGLSELERAVLSGVPQPIDTEAVRRAAVMRVRVACALATAPAAGGAVDAAAVSALLVEIDALLSDVNALAQGAPPELQPALEAVRNALVKEAIDFSEAAHRAQPAAELAPEAPAAPAGRAAQTRVLSVSTKAEAEIDAAQAARHRRMYVALAIVAIATAAFHGYGWWSDSQRADDGAPTRAAAPADAVISEAPANTPTPTVIRSKDLRPFTADELARIERDESVKGNTIREVQPGVIMIFPGGKGVPPPSAGPPAR